MRAVSKGMVHGALIGGLAVVLVVSAVGVWRTRQPPPHEPPFDPLAQALASGSRVLNRALAHDIRSIRGPACWRIRAAQGSSLAAMWCRGPWPRVK